MSPMKKGTIFFGESTYFHNSVFERPCHSFLDVTHWIVELQTHTYTCTPKVLLCGNKIDLHSERKVHASAAKKLADE